MGDVRGDFFTLRCRVLSLIYSKKLWLNGTSRLVSTTCQNCLLNNFSGSPFVFKVTAQPDASKVRVVGPGVEHGILATFVSRFIVETKGAGAGQLTVRIRGPKG